jgi:hypothetical protein
MPDCYLGLRVDRLKSFSDISLDDDVSCSLSYLDDQPNVSLDLPMNSYENDLNHPKAILPPFLGLNSDHVVTDDLTSEDNSQEKEHFPSTVIPRTPSDLYSSELDEDCFMDSDASLSELKSSAVFANPFDAKDDDLNLSFDTFDVKKDEPLSQMTDDTNAFISKSRGERDASLHFARGHEHSFERRMRFELEILRHCSSRTSFSRLGVSKVQKHILRSILLKRPSDRMDCENQLLRLYLSLGMKNAYRTKS